ncbi:hypothetical protein Rsub_12525 [Raphidocelis subcapitata]|uniref:CBM20 domain-containing protein n=1 Tax=Raphidocelis subcapitata TaxID=307507 RepID=A0A2V0PP23_9CHLO|nr:hypothetical protein Rsub_12525 [Raphidocelis subcapitata]|eukprot:GBF99750.1 hypothetical protein Rsub_12525 [Raphidocelis subcapitata]
MLLRRSAVQRIAGAPRGGRPALAAPLRRTALLPAPRASPDAEQRAASYYSGQPTPRLNGDGRVGHEGNGTGGGAADAAASTALEPAAHAGGALAPIPERVPVQFITHYVTSYGQILKVVGDAEELGAWSPERAPSMTWNEGHRWTLDTELPTTGPVNFKVVMAQDDGWVRWEEGEGDRSVDVAAVAAGAGGDGVPAEALGVACSWGDTAGTRVAATPDRSALRRRLRDVEARVAAVQQKRRRGGSRRAARKLAQRSGAAAEPEAAPVAAAAPPPQVQAPLLDPSELPPIGGAAPAAGAFGRLVGEVVGPAGLRAAAADAADADADAEPSPAERVLAATVEQLLAAASDALAAEAAPARDVAMGAAECAAQRAASLLGELASATAALEREAGLSATDVAALLTSAVGAAAAGQLPAAVRTASAAAEVAGQGAPADAPQPATAKGAGAAAARWRSAVSSVLAEVRAPDGSLVFSADSLSVQVDAQDLLLAALERARARAKAAAAVADAEAPEPAAPAVATAAVF